MLDINGPSRPLCDGISRRKFIEIGSLGVFGLSLSSLLQHETLAAADPAPAGRGHAARRSSKRSVILIWQHGGPSQLDTFDMKPDAPSEVRGPYQPMRTSLRGLDVCEHYPYQAKVMDKCTVIRSFSHTNGGHFSASHWMLTGRPSELGRVPSQPSMGSIISHMLGARKPGIMPYVNINDGGFGYHGASWLGLAQNPFRYGGYSYGDEGRPFPTVKLENFQLVDGLSRDRLMNRVSLKQQFELMRHRLDGNKTFDHIDSIDGRALDLIVSGRTQEAFDLDSEDAATRELYGPGWGEQALLARRLVQAGVRFVALNTGYWDDHGNIKGRLDDKLPRHDRAVGALIQDLANRDMLENTLVVTAGEFGRTPTINGNRGRDHWPLAQSILIAGGGYRHGQVIGTTNAKAEHPTSGDVGVEDFCAIIYHALGLKPTDTIKDHEDRPVHLLPGGRVPEELL